MTREQKLFFRYIRPSMIGMLIAGSFSIADTIFIGRGADKTDKAAAPAMHGVLLGSTAFILPGVIRVAGFYYQSTGKILDSSLLIYGDTFFALPLWFYTLPLWFGMDGVWPAMPASRIILFAFVLYLWFGKRSPREVVRHVGN